MNNLPAPRIHTRREYMNRDISHHDYYAQFVTDDTLRHIGLCFTVDELRTALAEDQHLNSIPISRWDTLAINELDQKGWSPSPRGRFVALIPFDRDAIAAADETVTRATLVCIAKTAARIIATVKHA